MSSPRPPTESQSDATCFEVAVLPVGVPYRDPRHEHTRCNLADVGDSVDTHLRHPQRSGGEQQNMVQHMSGKVSLGVWEWSGEIMTFELKHYIEGGLSNFISL